MFNFMFKSLFCNHNYLFLFLFIGTIYLIESIPLYKGRLQSISKPDHELVGQDTLNPHKFIFFTNSGQLTDQLSSESEKKVEDIKIDIIAAKDEAKNVTEEEELVKDKIEEVKKKIQEVNEKIQEVKDVAKDIKKESKEETKDVEGREEEGDDEEEEVEARVIIDEDNDSDDDEEDEARILSFIKSTAKKIAMEVIHDVEGRLCPKETPKESEETKSVAEKIDTKNEAKPSVNSAQPVVISIPQQEPSKTIVDVKVVPTSNIEKLDNQIKGEIEKLDDIVIHPEKY